MVAMEMKLFGTLSMLLFTSCEAWRSRPGVKLFIICVMIPFMAPSVNSLFFTMPVFHGVIQPIDPYVKVAEGSFQLECRLNVSTYEHHSVLNSTFMFWQVGDEILESGSYIINSSAIGLRVENISIAMSGEYGCYINESSLPGGRPNKFLYQTYVVIGNPPDPVTEVRCWSNNWEDLTCDWCPEEMPDRMTRWTLKYQIDEELVECPNYVGKCGCHWLAIDGENPVDSFKQGAVYYLEINTTSRFLDGSHYSKRQQINTSEYKIVKPGPVQGVNITALSSRTLFVSFVEDDKMDSVDTYNQILYYVNFTSEYGDQQEYLSLGTAKNVTISGLRPYTEYKVQVRCKTVDSEEVDMYWSDWSTGLGKTLANAAAVGPALPVGAYKWHECTGGTMSTQCMKLQVFWQELAMIDRNGPIEGYKVTFTPENGESDQVTWALPSSFSTEEELLASVGYKVAVQVITKEDSTGKTFLSPPSVILVQKYANKLEHPDAIVAETNEEEDGIWFDFVYTSSADNFTLLECVTSSNDQGKCQTSPKTFTVYGTERRYLHPTYDSEQSYALAVNREDYSSGLTEEWIPICRYNQLPGKPTFEVTAPHERSLTVKWKPLVCSHQTPEGVTTSYHIEWMVHDTVHGNMTVVSELEKTSYEVVIHDLVPHTAYTVNMVAESRAGLGTVQSEGEQTKQSVPGGPPENVLVVDVQASNMSIEWTPPSNPNGVIEAYNVIALGGTSNKNVSVSGDQTSTVITGLDGHINYTVQVIARNGAGKSPTSEPVFGKTLIKAPAMMTDAKTRPHNQSAILIEWIAPVPPNGPITSYIITSLGKDINESKSVPANESSYIMNFQQCGSDPVEVNVSMRAVTTDENGKEFSGKPSESQQNNICDIFDQNIILIVAISSAVFMFLVIVTTSTVYLCCKWKNYTEEPLTFTNYLWDEWAPHSKKKKNQKNSAILVYERYDNNDHILISSDNMGYLSSIDDIGMTSYNTESLNEENHTIQNQPKGTEDTSSERRDSALDSERGEFGESLKHSLSSYDSQDSARQNTASDHSPVIDTLIQTISTAEKVSVDESISADGNKEPCLVIQMPDLTNSRKLQRENKAEDANLSPVLPISDHIPVFDKKFQINLKQAESTSASTIELNTSGSGIDSSGCSDYNLVKTKETNEDICPKDHHVYVNDCDLMIKARGVLTSGDTNFSSTGASSNDGSSAISNPSFVGKTALNASNLVEFSPPNSADDTSTETSFISSDSNVIYNDTKKQRGETDSAYDSQTPPVPNTDHVNQSSPLLPHLNRKRNEERDFSTASSSSGGSSYVGGIREGNAHDKIPEGSKRPPIMKTTDPLSSGGSRVADNTIDDSNVSSGDKDTGSSLRTESSFVNSSSGTDGQSNKNGTDNQNGNEKPPESLVNAPVNIIANEADTPMILPMNNPHCIGNNEVHGDSTLDTPMSIPMINPHGISNSDKHGDSTLDTPMIITMVNPHGISNDAELGGSTLDTPMVIAPVHTTATNYDGEKDSELESEGIDSSAGSSVYNNVKKNEDSQTPLQNSGFSTSDGSSFYNGNFQKRHSLSEELPEGQSRKEMKSGNPFENDTRVPNTGGSSDITGTHSGSGDNIENSGLNTTASDSGAISSSDSVNLVGDNKGEIIPPLIGVDTNVIDPRNMQNGHNDGKTNFVTRNDNLKQVIHPTESANDLEGVHTENTESEPLSLVINPLNLCYMQNSEPDDVVILSPSFNDGGTSTLPPPVSIAPIITQNSKDNNQSMVFNPTNLLPKV